MAQQFGLNIAIFSFFVRKKTLNLKMRFRGLTFKKFKRLVPEGYKKFQEKRCASVLIPSGPVLEDQNYQILIFGRKKIVHIHIKAPKNAFHIILNCLFQMRTSPPVLKKK